MEFGWYYAAKAAYMFLAVLAMGKILLENRQPAKTMAWLLVLSFMPWLGLPLYFFFGRNRRKERYISRRSLKQISKRSSPGVSPCNRELLGDTPAKLFEKQGMPAVSEGNTAETFTTGRAFFASMIAGICSAKHHVHLSTYIMADDALGRLVADTLSDAAARGVEVRVVYDDVGCWKQPDGLFERMRRQGVEVHSFMPVRFPSLTGKVNYRNHRKMCVIDGAVGYIGGMNIAARYVGAGGERPWRDTHVMLKGSVVHSLQSAILADWYFVDRTIVSGPKYYRAGVNAADGCLAQVVTGSPVAEAPLLMQGYMSVIAGAKRYVYIETPYFLPTEPVMQALCAAAQSGVDVRVMVPMDGDGVVTRLAARSYLRQAAEAGVEVLMYSDGFNHSKILVSDDRICTCGSANVDFRSFENNFEANVFFYGGYMPAKLRDVFMEDTLKCTNLKETRLWMEHGILKRLTESALRLLSPLL